MAEQLDLVQGWTERIIVELSADDAVQDLTGMTVQLQAWSRGRLLTLSGISGALSGSESDGKVYFDPASSDLTAARSPLSIRWKVTDGSGKVAFFPKDEPDIWNVRLP